MRIWPHNCPKYLCLIRNVGYAIFFTSMYLRGTLQVAEGNSPMENCTYSFTSGSTFAGMDVHKKTIAFCVYSAYTGQALDERDLPHDLPLVIKYLLKIQDRHGKIHTCCEASSCGFGLQRAGSPRVFVRSGCPTSRADWCVCLDHLRWLDGSPLFCCNGCRVHLRLQHFSSYKS